MATFVLGILAAWGFAAWSFVMAVIIVVAYLRHLDLPYALSWWAYTLPLGSLAVASDVVGEGLRVCALGLRTDRGPGKVESW